MSNEQSAHSSPEQPKRPQVALFVTCLADLFRPSVALDSIALLEQAGCDVDVPRLQTCCGQPGYNSGDYEATIPLARQFIEVFESADYVVIPSGSCAGMIKHHYPKLLQGEWRQRALDLAARTYELTCFLTSVAEMRRGTATPVELGRVTYHDSCAGLRELAIKEQPRKLLKELCHTDLVELEQTEVCCGFGGAFCAKMPELSTKMSTDKVDSAIATGAQIIAGGDLGCLMNIAGRARRMGHDIEVRHIAELLLGDRDGPGIGEGTG
ncbi:MAG: (Fe-S)-binding protein [Halieaceae bacterium]|jgi:L-lactate dehydrogenase complex protein LldE|nr:(Fe-S)-binding protein [Halieaceae bacterium]